MPTLSDEYIKNNIADSYLIFQRGKDLYRYGSFFMSKENLDENEFSYDVDGNYGNYKTIIALQDDKIFSSCTCPYPGDGCKHVVAALMTTRKVLLEKQIPDEESVKTQTPYFSEQEIIEQAMADRDKRADRDPNQNRCV